MLSRPPQDPSEILDVPLNVFVEGGRGHATSDVARIINGSPGNPGGADRRGRPAAGGGTSGDHRWSGECVLAEASPSFRPSPNSPRNPVVTMSPNGKGSITNSIGWRYGSIGRNGTYAANRGDQKRRRDPGSGASPSTIGRPAPGLRVHLAIRPLASFRSDIDQTKLGAQLPGRISQSLTAPKPVCSVLEWTLAPRTKHDHRRAARRG